MLSHFKDNEKADLIVIIEKALADLCLAVKYGNHTNDWTPGFRTGQEVAYEAVLAYLIED